MKFIVERVVSGGDYDREKAGGRRRSQDTRPETIASTY
jgi:hypothetical protein